MTSDPTDARRAPCEHAVSAVRLEQVTLAVGQSGRLAERPQRDVGVNEDAPQLLVQA
jgi:hypothetical protein